MLVLDVTVVNVALPDIGGALHLDRAELRSLSDSGAYERHWAQPGPDRAAAALGFELPA